MKTTTYFYMWLFTDYEGKKSVQYCASDSPRMDECGYILLDQKEIDWEIPEGNHMEMLVEEARKKAREAVEKASAELAAI